MGHERAVAYLAFSESSVTFTLQVRCADAGVGKQVEFDLFEQLKKCFQEADIEIPFPYCNLVVENMPPTS
jgi:small-conductance mechanosensitive channel